jgi:hypothetical protein
MPEADQTDLIDLQADFRNVGLGVHATSYIVAFTISYLARISLTGP